MSRLSAAQVRKIQEDVTDRFNRRTAEAAEAPEPVDPLAGLSPEDLFARRGEVYAGLLGGGRPVPVGPASAWNAARAQAASDGD